MNWIKYVCLSQKFKHKRQNWKKNVKNSLIVSLFNFPIDNSGKHYPNVGGVKNNQDASGRKS